jgi:hypothetical protein
MKSTWTADDGPHAHKSNPSLLDAASQCLLYCFRHSYRTRSTGILVDLLVGEQKPASTICLAHYTEGGMMSMHGYLRAQMFLYFPMVIYSKLLARLSRATFFIALLHLLDAQRTSILWSALEVLPLMSLQLTRRGRGRVEPPLPPIFATRTVYRRSQQ